MKKPLLCAALLFLRLICGYADTGGADGDITNAKIESFYNEELSLAVGQTDAGRYFKLSGVSAGDIEFVSADSAVCTVE
ncbi:MAG: hypothetical protein IJS44_00150, partial [Clostridia bacterium]|nr:hypothetical protein [Clostridia bacterium]